MKQVYQSIIDSEKGDCERAAIASLLEVELDQIPYWENDEKYHSNQKKWLKDNKIGMIECYNYPEQGFPFRLTVVDGVECIASVPSQLFENRSHAIIARFELQESGVMHLVPIHDPNPQNSPYPDNIMDLATWVTFILPQSNFFKESS